MPERGTDIKTLKKECRPFATPCDTQWQSIAVAPHSIRLTQILSAKTFRKSRGKDAFRIYSQIGKRRFCKADLNFTEKAFGDKGG